MLLEAEKQRLQEDLEKSRGEQQKNMRELQVLQARLKDAITWDEHCNIAGKLRRYCCNVLFYQIFLCLKDELISVIISPAAELGHNYFALGKVTTGQKNCTLALQQFILVILLVLIACYMLERVHTSHFIFLSKILNASFLIFMTSFSRLQPSIAVVSLIIISIEIDFGANKTQIRQEE